MDDYCNSDGKLDFRGRFGYRWSASPDDDDARFFKFNKDRGELIRGYRNYALPVRPVLK